MARVFHELPTRVPVALLATSVPGALPFAA